MQRATMLPLVLLFALAAFSTVRAVNVADLESQMVDEEGNALSGGRGRLNVKSPHTLYPQLQDGKFKAPTPPTPPSSWGQSHPSTKRPANIGPASNNGPASNGQSGGDSPAIAMAKQVVKGLIQHIITSVIDSKTKEFTSKKGSLFSSENPSGHQQSNQHQAAVANPALEPGRTAAPYGWNV